MKVHPSQFHPSLRLGAGLGARYAFYAATSYLLLYLIVVVVDSLRSTSLNSPAPFLSVLVLIGAWGMALGVVPAVLIGATTGLFIAGIARWARGKHLTVPTPLVATVVCLSLAIPVNLFYFVQLQGSDPRFGDAYLRTYTFFLGIPSGIYLILGVYLSQKLEASLRA